MNSKFDLHPRLGAGSGAEEYIATASIQAVTGRERMLWDRPLIDHAQASPSLRESGYRTWRFRLCSVNTGARAVLGLDSPVLALYEMRDGKLVRAQMFYFDPTAVVDFLATAMSRAA